MGTYNSNILPSTTGLNLGNPVQRWTIYAQDFDAAGLVTFNNLNGIRFAGQSYTNGTTIQAAITDAGTTGTVIIPSTYTASDTFTNPNNILILDFRGQQFKAYGKVAADKAIIQKEVTVSYSATPTFDASLANVFKISLTGNVTSSTLSNVTSGQIITIIVTQTSGGNTFVPPGNVSGWIPVGSGAGVSTVETFVVDGSTARAVSTVSMSGGGTSGTLARWTGGTVLGNSSITDDGTKANASILNGVVMVDRQAGATAGDKLIAANNILQSNGGGTMDARGLRASGCIMTIPGQVVIGPNVTWLIDPSDSYLVTYSGGGAAIQIKDKSCVIGLSPKTAVAAGTFLLDPSSNIHSLFYLHALSSFKMQGFQIDGGTGTVGQSIIYVDNCATGTSSGFQDIGIVTRNHTGIWLAGSGNADIYLMHCTVSGGNTFMANTYPNARPLLITGINRAIEITGGFYVSPGGANFSIEVDGLGIAGIPIDNLTLVNVYMENAQPLSGGLKLRDVVNVSVMGLLGGPTGGGADGTAVVDISQSFTGGTSSITLQNIEMFGTYSLGNIYVHGFTNASINQSVTEQFVPFFNPGSDYVGATRRDRFQISALTLGGVGYNYLPDNAGNGTILSGTLMWCNDCQATNPCSAGGFGALAKSMSSPAAWDCT